MITDGYIVRAPASRTIGQFNTKNHQVSSGDVIITSDRTITITDFTYDGAGPGKALSPYLQLRLIYSLIYVVVVN